MDISSKFVTTVFIIHSVQWRECAGHCKKGRCDPEQAVTEMDQRQDGDPVLSERRRFE
jgi:hypothetical protein